MSSNITPALDSTPNVPVLQLFSLQGQTALVTGANRGKSGSHHLHTIATLRLDIFYDALTFTSFFVCGVISSCLIGIGASIALALAQAGAHVILVHRSPSTATTTLDTIRSQGYPASVVYADLADKEQVKALYASALEILKTDTTNQRTRIEIVVHAAGIQRRAPAAEFKDDEWEEVSCLVFFCGFHTYSFRSGLHQLYVKKDLTYRT
jgi:2-dehydro-3-deoxy-D-gluconate 5-dehydrogenase